MLGLDALPRLEPIMVSPTFLLCLAKVSYASRWPTGGHLAPSLNCQPRS